MARYSYLVISNPVEGQEAEYNRWYTEQHLPDVLRVPGFVAAQRFEVAEKRNNLPGGYVAIYEIETDDPEGTMAAMQAAATNGGMVMSDTIDLKTTSATLLKAITDRKTA